MALCKKWGAKKLWQEWLLWAILMTVVGYTGYCIFVNLNPYHLNSDIVNEISFRQLSWESKSLFPTGYVCSNESFVSRPVLLYWLYYGISGNFLLSYQLESLTMLLALLVALWGLLKELAISPLSSVFALIMFVLWTSWECNSIVYYPCDAYAKIILFFLLTLILRIRLERTLNSEPQFHKKAVCIIVALAIIAILLGFGTPRGAVILYIPLLIVDVFSIFRAFTNKRSIQQSDSILACVSVGLLLLNLFAYAVLLRYHSATLLPMGMQLANAGVFLQWSVLSAQIQSVLNACGLGFGADVVSLAGVKIVCRLFFVLIACYFAMWSIRQNRDTNIAFWGISLLVIFLCSILLGFGFDASRYYFPVGIAVPILCAMALDSWTMDDSRIVHKIPWYIAVILSVILTVCVGCSEQLISEAGSSDLYKVAKYIEDNGYEYVTASYWNAGVIKGYTNGAVEALHSSPDPHDIASLGQFHWIIDTTKFSDQKIGIRNILLLTDEEERLATEKAGSVNELLKKHAEKVMEIGDYNLYALTENPFTLVQKIETSHQGGLPLAGVALAVDYPTDSGYQFGHAKLNEKNELVSNGSAGFIMWGPYSESVQGVYDITLHYVVEAYDTDSTGEFDVALDTERYAYIEFSAEDTTATLDDIFIEKGHLFEARVIVPDGMIVRVQSVDYRRVG